MKRAWLVFLALLIALPVRADSPIIWYGTHSKDLTASGMAFKNGSAGTPSMSYISAPSTGLFLDGSGNVGFTKAGTNTLAVGTGLSFPATFTPVNNEGSLTQHAFQTSLNPAGNVTTGSARNLIQLEQNIGADDSGFSVDTASGLQVNLNSRNKSSWNNLSPLQVNSTIGNGTDPQTGNSLQVATLTGNVQSGATVNFYQGLELDMNAPAGSTLGNYIGLNTNGQIAAATNYNGIHFGDTLGTVVNVVDADFSTNVTGSVAQFHGLTLDGTLASVTGGYDGFHAQHNLTLTNSAQVFADTNQVTAMTAGASYNSFNASPNIGAMTGGYFTLRSFPVIGTGNGITVFEDATSVVTSAANYLGINFHPSLLGMTGDVNGIIFQPSGATATNATGLSIDMTGITAGGSLTAINTTGAPVNVSNGNLNVNTGSLHVNAANQAFVNVGNPTPVHNINTPFVAPANTVVASADGFGFAPVTNVTLGHDSHITSGGLRLGTASLGMISLMTLDDSSDIQDVGGSFVAQILTGGTGAGGVATNLYGYRYVAGNAGSPSSILNARAYLADDPLGAPATNAWGMYSKASYENYFGKSIKIGGAPNGTNDKVSNASVGLEIEGAAFYPQPMTTVTRNALTALQGMLVNNVTTGFLERYDGAAWQPVAAGSYVPTTRTISTTAPLTGGGDLSADRTLAMPAATAIADGYLTAADWAVFNAKQPAGNYITATTGDVVATGPGSVSATIQPLAVTNAKIANGTIDLTAKVAGVLPVANGGTNSAAALANNRIIESAGGALIEAAAITANRALISNASGIPTQSATTDTELGYVSGVTSAIQTQLNGKEPTITVLPIAKGGTNSGTALVNNRIMQSNAGSIIEVAAITANRALVSNASGIPTQSSVTDTELGYVSGVTSAIQTQLNAKQATISPQTFGATPNSSGFSVSGANVTLQPADATNGGGVSIIAQIFAGLKTFGAGIKLGGAGTQATFNDYRTNGSFTLAFTTGVTPNPTNVTCAYVLVDKQVTIHVISTTTFTILGTPFVLQTATSALPPEITPTHIVQGFIYATGSALTPSVPAAFAIETNGRVDLYKNGNEDNMVATTSYGLQPGNTITYTLL